MCSTKQSSGLPAAQQLGHEEASHVTVVAWLAWVVGSHFTSHDVSALQVQSPGEAPAASHEDRSAATLHASDWSVTAHLAAAGTAAAVDPTAVKVHDPAASQVSRSALAAAHSGTGVVVQPASVTRTVETAQPSPPAE